MPMKGFWTQGVMVLSEAALTPKSIEKALTPYKFKHKPPESKPNWSSGYPTWYVSMRKEVNGIVAVDVVNSPWPDHMGDNKKEMDLFAAWSMGFMGPHTWPDALERARHYARATGQDFVA